MIIDEFFRPLFADLERLISSKPQDQHPEPADLEQRIEQRLAGELEDFLYDEDLIKVVQHVLSCPKCMEQAARWQAEQIEQERRRLSWPWHLPERINAFGELSKQSAVYVPVLYTAVALLLTLTGVIVSYFLGAVEVVGEVAGGGGNPMLRIY